MTDPLNVSIPLAGVETSIPLLPEGEYILQCSEATVDPNKDQNGFNLNMTLNTTETVTAVDDREVKPNFPLYFTNALQARSDSKDPEAFRRNLASTVDAFFRTSKENRPEISRELIASMVGKQVIATVVHDTYEEVVRAKVKRIKATE
jgi:hypothetical protein